MERGPKHVGEGL